MNIKELLLNGIEKLNRNLVQEANLKVRLILAFILDEKKEYLIINNKKELTKEVIDKFNEDLDLLIKGKPIQYIIKKQEFMALDFYVDENVLIPQPDTEILVEEVINICKKEKKDKILDLCTGSGAIAISIANNIDAKIVATDILEKALKIAQTNASKHQISNIEFIKSDMFENIKGKFDIIVSNPPYIETDIIKTLAKEVQNEPIIALDGGTDGLDFYKIIADKAYEYLNKNGVLILEIGYDQKQSVINLLKKTDKYKYIECKKDFSNNDRMIIAKKV